MFQNYSLGCSRRGVLGAGISGLALIPSIALGSAPDDASENSVQPNLTSMQPIGNLYTISGKLPASYNGIWGCMQFGNYIFFVLSANINSRTFTYLFYQDVTNKNLALKELKAPWDGSVWRGFQIVENRIYANVWANGQKRGCFTIIDFNINDPQKVLDSRNLYMAPDYFGPDRTLDSDNYINFFPRYVLCGKRKPFVSALDEKGIPIANLAYDLPLEGHFPHDDFNVVSRAGSWLFVSNPNDMANGSPSAVVYQFEINAVTCKPSLLGTYSKPNDASGQFGSVLTSSKNFLVVGDGINLHVYVCDPSDAKYMSRVLRFYLPHNPIIMRSDIRIISNVLYVRVSNPYSLLLIDLEINNPSFGKVISAAKLPLIPTTQGSASEVPDNHGQNSAPFYVCLNAIGTYTPPKPGHLGHGPDLDTLSINVFCPTGD